MAKAMRGDGKLRAQQETARVAAAEAMEKYHNLMTRDPSATRRNQTQSEARKHAHTAPVLQRQAAEIAAVSVSAADDHRNQATALPGGIRRRVA